jgi:hypothetical protein
MSDIPKHTAENTFGGTGWNEGIGSSKPQPIAEPHPHAETCPHCGQKMLDPYVPKKGTYPPSKVWKSAPGTIKPYKVIY